MFVRMYIRMIIGFVCMKLCNIPTPIHIQTRAYICQAARYEVGKQMQFRVLTVDAANAKLLLTHKPSIVKSELPLITSYDQVRSGRDMVSISKCVCVWGRGGVVCSRVL